MTNENNTVNFDIEQIEYLVNQTREALNQTFDLSNKVNEMVNSVIALKSDIAKLNNRVTAYEQGISVDGCRDYSVNEFMEYLDRNTGKKYYLQTLGDGFFDANVTSTLEYDELVDEFRVAFKDGDFSFSPCLINNVCIYNNGKIEVEFTSTVSQMEFTPITENK